MEPPASPNTLESELAGLRAANAALTERLARLEAVIAADTDRVDDSPTGDTRRGVLKLIAGAAGGAVAATVLGGRSVAAADGAYLTMGSRTTADTRPTSADYVGGETTGSAFLFQAGDAQSGEQAVHSSALAGWVTEGGRMLNGVYGYSNQPGAAGLVGVGDHGDGTGIRARGNRAAIALLAVAASPVAGNAVHSAGEIQFDVNGELWACVTDGAPGTWRKLAGPSSAGSFHPIQPARVYDSRLATYTPSGRLLRNENRVVKVSDGRSSGGAVTAADIVPPGATAIAYNLTVAGPQGPNYLSITPGDATSFTASAINFNGTSDVANGGIVRIDANRQVKVFCGDQAGSTNVILDVTGYFR